MSIAIANVMSHMRNRLPSTASVSHVGATFYVRGEYTQDDIDALNGDVVDDRKIEKVDYFSDEHKTVFKIRSAVPLTR